MEIEVKIRALMMDPNSGTPIIILKDVQSDTMLPIWVGLRSKRHRAGD
jgi:bifunctional DNase/RNase